MSRFKYGFCEWSLNARGLELCKILADQGLTCMQVGVGTEALTGKGLADPALVEEYLEGSEKYNIDICGTVPISLDYFSYTRPKCPEEEEMAVKMINMAIDLCSVFDCKTYLLPALNNSAIVDGPSFHRAVAQLKRFCDKAAEMGVVTLFESTLSVSRTIDVLEAVDHPMLKLFFDSQNTYAYDGTFAAGWFKELSPLIYEIHLKDGVDSILSGSILGEGTSGFHKTAQAIIDSGFSGNLLLENCYEAAPLCYQGDPMDLLAKDVQVLHDIFDGK